MKTTEENRNREQFDQKVAQVFQSDLPEMPSLPEDGEELLEVQELDMESLDQLQAAGEMMSGEILRFLHPSAKS